MAQVSIYIPDDEAERLRREAEKVSMPLSRYVSTLIGKKKDGWPKGYFERTCGFLEGEFPLPEDRPPEPVEWDE